MLGSTDEITVSIGPFFPFPFLSSPDPDSRPVAVVFWACAITPNPFGRFHSLPYLLPWQPPCCNLFGSTRGNFGPKSHRGKILLLCNIIRSHDVMMGRTFNFVYALSTTDGRRSYRVLSEGTAKDKIRTKKRETSVSRRGKSLTNQVIGTLQKPWFICLTVNL